ncbi:MAG TPA: LPS export ABC transporter periplasmic protein LptC [Magnetospirillaceae bacterium]|jgi:lipopolysaccharide export system protein LptC
MKPIAILGPAGRPHRMPPQPRALKARYSRFVGLMKVVLPAVAAALLGLLIVWPRLSPQHEATTVGFTQPDAARVDNLSIRNPKYYGTDEKNLPFTVTADVATQLDPNNMVVTLEKPTADLVNGGGTGMVVDANIGFYRQKDDTLDLMGHVDLYRDDGYELHTESARIQIAKGNSSGDQPITGQGPAGTLSGEGFTSTDRGRTIVFTGKSKAVLMVGQPHAKSGS